MVQKCDLDKLLGWVSGVFKRNEATGLVWNGLEAHRPKVGKSRGHERTRAWDGALFLPSHSHFFILSLVLKNMHSDSTIQKHLRNKQEEWYHRTAKAIRISVVIPADSGIPPTGRYPQVFP